MRWIVLGVSVVVLTLSIVAITLVVSSGESNKAFSNGKKVTASPEEKKFIPASLFNKDIGLREGSVEIPISLIIPSIGVDSSMLGVGVTSDNVMDAPKGNADSQLWHQAFWFRGSAIPGEKSTALIAGHAQDPKGREGVFGKITKLEVGDLITIRDSRNNLDVNFSITKTKSYTLQETRQTDVLNEIYGSGPVAGLVPQKSEDGLARLTLITCSGIFSRDEGTHDHRFVVYATRV